MKRDALVRTWQFAAPRLRRALAYVDRAFHYHHRLGAPTACSSLDKIAGLRLALGRFRSIVKPPHPGLTVLVVCPQSEAAEWMQVLQSQAVSDMGVTGRLVSAPDAATEMVVGLAPLAPEFRKAPVREPQEEHGYSVLL